MALLRIVAYQSTMARKPRVEFAGAFYHVICRGNQRQVIFRGDADREYYLELVEQYRERYGFKIPNTHFLPLAMTTKRRA